MLEKKIIATLFLYGESISLIELARLLSAPIEEIEPALRALAPKVQELGLTLLHDGKEIELRTSAEMSALSEQIRKDAFSRDIGKAGIETLSILVYKGSATRSEIDYIRGVNSAHILRALSMRGLARKITNPKDERSFLYEPTTDLLAHLGVSSISELPDYESVRASIESLEKTESPSAEGTESDEIHND